MGGKREEGAYGEEDRVGMECVDDTVPVEDRLALEVHVHDVIDNN